VARHCHGSRRRHRNPNRAGLCEGRRSLGARQLHSQCIAPGGTALANANPTASGWTVGGGVEWSFAGNWSAFAEYNYLDFGTPGVTFTSIVGGPTFPINVKENINSFMVGVNYRFGAIGY
jgi:opacity protein-like surface antigen